MIAGIDVGVKKDYLAVIRDDKVVYVGELDLNLEFKFAGIDAPLSFPKRGYFRECEKKLQKMGIRILPPLFIREIAEKGIKIAKNLRDRNVEVFEVYPYATRVLLSIAPHEKKRKREGMLKILKDLREYIDVPDVSSHDLIDAVISALTVKMFVEGKGEMICGEDGCIIVPKI